MPPSLLFFIQKASRHHFLMLEQAMCWHVASTESKQAAGGGATHMSLMAWIPAPHLFLCNCETQARYWRAVSTGRQSMQRAVMLRICCPQRTQRLPLSWRALGRQRHWLTLQRTWWMRCKFFLSLLSVRLRISVLVFEALHRCTRADTPCRVFDLFFYCHSPIVL